MLGFVVKVDHIPRERFDILIFDQTLEKSFLF